VTTVGGVAEAAVCAGVLDDCPRLALGGRSLFLAGVLATVDVAAVGGVAGVVAAVVCAGVLDDCPRLVLGGRSLFLAGVLAPVDVTAVGGVAGVA
jgi:hypothetical protein